MTDETLDHLSEAALRSMLAYRRHVLKQAQEDRVRADKTCGTTLTLISNVRRELAKRGYLTNG